MEIHHVMEMKLKPLTPHATLRFYLQPSLFKSWSVCVENIWKEESVPKARHA